MKMPDIPNNKDVIDLYINHLNLHDLKESTISSKTWALVPFFKFTDNKAVTEVTRLDVEKFAISIKKIKKKSTQSKNLRELRDFFKWYKPDNDFFQNIKMRREKPDHSKKEYVTSKDVALMLPHCISQRDRAFIFLLWESAARLGETLALNVEDIKPAKYGITVTVTGKTGKRDILVIDCVPDLQLWLNMYHGNPEDPLFPIRGNGRLAARGAQTIILKLQIAAGLTNKRIHAHGFRHGRLTELSNLGMSEMQLRWFAGWDEDSDMPATYIHVKESDVVNKLLSIKGIKPEEEEVTEYVTRPRVCPRCKTENPFDSKYCRSCSMILDPAMAANMEKDSEDLNMAIMRAIAMNPAVFDELNRRIKTFENNKN